MGHAWRQLAVNRAEDYRTPEKKEKRKRRERWSKVESNIGIYSKKTKQIKS